MNVIVGPTDCVDEQSLLLKSAVLEESPQLNLDFVAQDRAIVLHMPSDVQVDFAVGAK
jgi:hypothetical protein